MYFRENESRKNDIISEIAGIYGENAVERNLKRYQNIAEQYTIKFGDQNYEFFSAPGRTEIIGNHTDHNHGKVLAGSINMDCIAAAGVNYTSIIRIISETYSQDISIDCNKMPAVQETKGTLALISGILNGFQTKGYAIGGVNIYTTSDVIGAAGVSSSASFEMLLCKIFDYFFNGDNLNPVVYSQIGKYSENVYWQKNSGLLDQMACAVGGVVALNFKDELNPEVERLEMDFRAHGYEILIVNTGKSHADLSKEYSSIPEDMKKVAKFFCKESLVELCLNDIIQNAKKIRQMAGDRAFLRAVHYFEENQRVTEAVEALHTGDIETFLQTISESGNSSWKYLQNCALDSCEQPVSAALVLAKLFIREIGAGVCRVHGGGFAGVIMAVIPCDYMEKFTRYMESQLETGCVYPISIRQKGVIRLEI